MNIWFFNHYAVPPWFYPLARPYNFAKNLLNKGHDVTIFAASTVHNSDINLIEDNSLYKVEKIEGIQYVYIKTSNYKNNGINRIKNMVEYSFKLFKVAKHFKRPELIIATSVHPLTWVSGYKLSKKYKVRFFAETADLWPETLVSMGKIKGNSIPAKLLYKLEKFIYVKADKLIFTFPGGKDYVKSIGLDSSKVRYINNGVDIDGFNNDKHNFNYEDVDLDSNHKFKVLYTGSMGTANELSYLIQAAEDLQSKGIDRIRFILFGEGYERVLLEEYVNKNKITNIIFKGKVDKKFIPSILSKSDLNIVTGKYIDLYKYGLSLNKLFDYFASGKPTLSNIECGYDMLDEYKCGLTVKGGSKEALVEGILKFYNMGKKDYEEYTNNALKSAIDFDYKKLTDQLQKVIMEV